MDELSLLSRFRGCILGGALGDALGYPVEFLQEDEINKRYGRNGITELKADKQLGVALVSDDTQMTLFTAEGIMWAHKLGGKDEIASYTSYVFYAYQRWLYTQTGSIASRLYADALDKDSEYASKLLQCGELFSRRAPGNTCLMALSGASDHNYGRLINKINDSKGCGGVMRVAPAGLYFMDDSEKAFRMAAEFSAITHTHPTGYLAGGSLGSMIAELANGSSLDRALDVSMHILKDYDNCMETLRALDSARTLEAGDTPPQTAVKRLGEGWIAEEALAIGVYCALCHYDNAENAMRLAVNHSGDSDSTGAICGNIIGAHLGYEALPQKWLKRLELCDVIDDTAKELYECCIS